MASLIRNPGAFAVYVLVACITPGPNNLMLMTVGLVKGVGAGVRTSLGVSTGWGLQVLICGIGVGAAIRAVPGLATGIELCGIAYLLWLARKLWLASSIGDAAPMMGFGGAFFFQWINPKALSMSLSTAGLFVVNSSGATPLQSATAVALGAMVLSVPCSLTWALSGSVLSNRLRRDGAAERFNRAASITLVALAVWLVVSNLP